ncbi:MAG TPA: aminoacyl-tRNA hydrolase [Bacteroidia bacterium]|jgi:PTH1 family peptidyl-tRNA hydrolase|nr:aminoacyl-tRNA hydrolase [Bacteroidia bacterium]
MSKFLVAGLGNIGDEYANTRHNIGFRVLDTLAKKEGFSFRTDRLAAVAEYKFKGKIFILIKPSTYMNLSGKAINYWMQAEKIHLENVLVVTDDLALPFGTLRMKTKGSDGGHNGLKSIQETLNNTEYTRLRFGIGSEFSKGKQVDYVLGQWSAEEEGAIGPRIEMAVEIIKSYGTIGASRTMSLYNNK